MSCKRDIDKTYRQVRAEIALGEENDYSITYAKIFALVDPVDTISSSTWVLSGNGTLGAMTISGAIATAWITPALGARVGNILRLTNTVVTAGGRTHVRLIIIKIVNRLALVPEEEA